LELLTILKFLNTRLEDLWDKVLTQLSRKVFIKSLVNHWLLKYMTNISLLMCKEKDQ
jgi:hypothetical protein